MADSKITDLTDGGTIQAGDEFVVARAGADNKIAGSNMPVVKLYDYTVSGSDKASIDTQVDDGGNGAAALPTSYALLEIYIYARTDEAVELTVIDLTFNNDGGANYDREMDRSRGSTASAINSLASSNLQMVFPGASAAANVFGGARVILPNYGGTVGMKVGELVTWCPVQSTNAGIDDMAIGYRSTSAISRAKITPDTSGKKLKVGTRLLIYARP
jgi:hypothetical protein